MCLEGQGKPQTAAGEIMCWLWFELRVSQIQVSGVTFCASLSSIFFSDACVTYIVEVEGMCHQNNKMNRSTYK